MPGANPLLRGPRMIRCCLPAARLSKSGMDLPIRNPAVQTSSGTSPHRPDTPLMVFSHLRARAGAAHEGSLGPCQGPESALPRTDPELSGPAFLALL